MPIHEVYSQGGTYLGNYYYFGQNGTVGYVWNAIRMPDDATGTFRTAEEAEAWIRQEFLHFYECGSCGYYHKLAYMGDCRDDRERFYADDLDELYGESWIIFDTEE